MNRFHWIAILVVFFLPSGDAFAQILLDPLQGGASDASSGLSGPGTLFGSPQRSNSNSLAGEEDDDDGGSRLYAPGGGYSPGSMFRPMTREDVVRKKQEDALRKKMKEREEWQRVMREFRVKESVDELLEKSRNYVPTELRNPSSDSLAEKELGGKTDPVKPSDPEPAQSDPLRIRPAERLPVDEISDEERTLRDWKRQWAELEKAENTEENERQKKALEDRIRTREQYLARRAESERGADPFQIPASLKLTESQLKEGWCNLFDGKTFFGWRPQQEGHYGGGQFHIVQNEIRSDPRHPGLLYTTNQFGDTTVSMEFYAEDDAEAYLLLRTSPDPRDIYSSCYAIVLNSNDFQTPPGSVLSRQQLSLEQLQEMNLRESNRRTDEKQDARWRKLTAQFDGSSLTVTLDREEPITHYDAKPLGYGYIGLLVTKGNVRFRNLFWRPGSSLPLFDGITPDKHWRHRADVIQLAATRNISMQINGGPGVIETLEKYDNFILQLEYNIAYTSARSGIFFRSSPRVEQSGYEVSLQNFPRRSDRDSIVGVDAGAFRNRKNARYVRAEDQKWNYVTLVAVDRQFQTWINGIPVCEMSDRRPFPGEGEDGPFLESGTIQLSAPEASSNLQFRNIRVTPLVPRTDKPKTFEDRTKATWDSLVNERREREKEQRLDDQMRGKSP